jgi:EmrB/QacA subfamily drug resistance transporter
MTVQMTSTTSGYSRFKIHETPDIREIDFIFANDAMEYVRDLFPLLFSHRPLLGRDKNGKNHLTERTEGVGTAVSEVSSPDPNQHSNGQFRQSESQVRFRSAHVRLVPLEQAQQLHEGGYQAEATDVVETFSEYSTSQIKSALDVKTLADVSPPQARAADVEETLSPVSSSPQPHVAAEPAPTESKPLTSALKWQVAAVVAIGMALSVMDNTIISVTLPQMQRAFQTDFETITWVATIYFLTQAAVIPIVGYLSDRIGSKLAFLGALTLFIIGSVLCALAPTKEALIAFRGLQGIGGGALIPVGTAILFRIFPPNERGKATAMAGIPILMAPALGPSLGGYLSTAFNWEAIFIINIPIGIVALVLALFVLPGRAFGQAEQMSIQTATSRQRFDILGFLLSMAGFTILVYGISEAASKGWSDQTVLTSLIVAAVLLIALIGVELLVSDPVMDLRLFKNYTFNIANLLMMISAAVFYGSLFLLPLFFENVQGNTSLTTGTFLIGQGLGTAVGVVVSGMLYNRVGPRILTALGLLFLASGTYMLTQIDINTTGQELQVTLALRGFGAGFFIMHLQTLALSVVSNEAMAKASSLLGIMRQVATALGVTGLTTYLVQQATTHATEIKNALLEGQQTHHLSGVAATCAQAGGPTQHLEAIKACVAQQATITGLTDTFWIALLLPAACVLLALFLGRDPAVEAHKIASCRDIPAN